MQKLLIATTNPGKVKEFKELLPDQSFDIKTLADFKAISEPIENGKTFAENSALKSTYYALATNCWALADDSGLEVQALNNAPGVFSARYAGHNASDLENITKLIDQLTAVASADRTARFVCEMALSDEQGNIIKASRGICDGIITLTPTGKNGFGYDPIFIPKGFSNTFGELSGDIKKQISHRSQAMKQIIEFLSKYCLS